MSSKSSIIVSYPSIHWDKIGNKTGNFAFNYRGITTYYILIFSFSDIILNYHCKIISTFARLTKNNLAYIKTTYTRKMKFDIFWITGLQFYRHLKSISFYDFSYGNLFTFTWISSKRLTFTRHPRFDSNKIGYKRRHATF